MSYITSKITSSSLWSSSLHERWKENARPYKHPKPKIVILGAGAWGTALGHVLAEVGHFVTMWGRSKEKIEYYKKTVTHPSIGAEVRLSAKLHWSSDLESVLQEAEIIFLALPTQKQYDFLEQHKALFPLKALLIQTAKGIHIQSSRLAYRIVEDILPSHAVVLLSGPSFAKDVAMNKPTAITVAADRSKEAYKIQSLFYNTPIRPYRSKDKIGVGYGGALKNILAIAAGYIQGYALGESAKTALITRGFSEICRFSVSYGAQKETLAGLSGMGDILLTCGSRQSRNFDYGYQLGYATKHQLSFQTSQNTIEGKATLKAIYPLIEAKALDYPILSHLYSLLEGTRPIEEIIQDIFKRPLKKEV